MAPSAYFKRQCFVSVECDEEPVKHVIDAIGDDRIVFSTDFPHGDSKFPRAVESFLTLPIPEESKRKILWDNCAAYYGLRS
jgi:predicted TIM-barrel fold metal-dependent hydrolase